MKFRVGFIVAAAVALCGCSHHRDRAQPTTAGASDFSSLTQSKVVVTPDNSLEGKIVRFNPAGRFVVIAFPIGHLPAIEQRMMVYRAGSKVGEVKITGPQIDDKVVADISSGEAGEGDVVRDK